MNEKLTPHKVKKVHPFGIREIKKSAVLIKEMIKLAGSSYKLATLMGISQPRIYQFLCEGVTPSLVNRMCELSGNKIKPWELRPDYYPPPGW